MTQTELNRFAHYRSSAVALLTRHQKAVQIAPALAPLGLKIIETTAFDTDQLGSFSGEIARQQSALDCAREKARRACALTGLRLGLGSEGSFGGGPYPGLLNWDHELLLLHDAQTGHDITAVAAGPISVTWAEVSTYAALVAHVQQYPADQAWILRLGPRVLKGLHGLQAIAEALASAQVSLTEPWSMAVRIEPDLRAMHCPERREHIARAAQQLAERLQAPCPACSAPNFWPDAVLRGLPCRDCDSPTALPRAVIKRCTFCQHEQQAPTSSAFADPGQCQWCNP